MKGKVKFFKADKGYGFVTADDGTDYFVHISGIEDGLELKSDMAVMFEIEEGNRGPKAVKVKKADAKKETQKEPADEKEPADDFEDSDDFDED